MLAQRYSHWIWHAKRPSICATAKLPCLRYPLILRGYKAWANGLKWPKKLRPLSAALEGCKIIWAKN